jgi:hypothetical protein
MSLYSRIFVDSRLRHMFMLKMEKSFWDLGDFPSVVQNGSEAIILKNPWANGTKAAPFDQRTLSDGRRLSRPLLTVFV